VSTKAETLGNAEQSNLDLEHSSFIAESSKKDKWKKGESSKDQRDQIRKIKDQSDSEQLEGRRGNIMSTSSHLLKLVLPLAKRNHKQDDGDQPPTVFLLHPSQPLSHISRLIVSSLAPSTPDISFRAIPPPGHDLDFNKENDEVVEWSDSTDIGDFVKDASRNKQFEIIISEPTADSRKENIDKGADSQPSSEVHSESVRSQSIMVTVPSFHQRTRYLRAKLTSIQSSVSEMQSLKAHCDKLAHRGARRTAVGIFFALLSYWGVIARLTFWDYGWDTMEPITYLSGLSTVITGYVWFLWHNREVSYTSVLSQSISVRRDALYRKHGLDLDDLMDKVSMMKALKKEIKLIAEEYDVKWEESENGNAKDRERGRDEDDHNPESEESEHTGRAEKDASEGDQKKDSSIF